MKNIKSPHKVHKTVRTLNDKTAKDMAYELLEKFNWDKNDAINYVEEIIFAICGNLKICNSETGLFYKDVKKEIITS